MKQERGRETHRRDEGDEGPEDDEDGKDPSRIDTEGGGAHLVDVIALNTIREIIQLAKEEICEQEGPFTIPSYVMDKLLVRCEKVLLNYGVEEARKAMVVELMDHLRCMDEFKDRDNERKVRERLPSGHARQAQDASTADAPKRGRRKAARKK